MVHIKHNPLRVDFKESTLWALNSINSVGVGAGPVGVGLSLFDLVNRETFRAHRLAVAAGGVSKGPPKVAISGSFHSWSDYAYFKTTKPVSFKDFDGTMVDIEDISIAAYSWTSVSFSFAANVRIKGWAVNIPGASQMTGISQVLYSDGKALGDVTFEIQMPTPEPDPPPVRIVQKEEARVYHLANDVLFDFDKYTLKTNQRTQDALIMTASDLSLSGPEFNFLIVGHTDSKGSAEHNKRLSKHRAETVAKWISDHNYVKADRMKTVGMGFSEPVASNKTVAGRAENRRVEAWALRTEVWKSW
jgi:outer membrane protein OmpA-like peptidoglycan-associated protein